MHELVAGIFTKCTTYGSAIFSAARRNDTSALKGLLNKFSESPNKFNKDRRTPLSISLLAKSYDATVLLLEFGADPNVVVKRHGELYEKIPQFDINLRDVSNLILLAMYGATLEGLVFSDGFEKEKKVFEEAIDKQAFLHAKLARITAELKEASLNHRNIIKYYQEAADVWFDLAKEESNSVYRQHYYTKALQLLQQAENHFHKLPKIAIKLDDRFYAKLFERLADISTKINKSSKAVEYSQMAAKLITTNHHLTFFDDRQGAVSEQEAPLLSGQSSSEVHHRAITPSLSAGHSKTA